MQEDRKQFFRQVIPCDILFRTGMRSHAIPIAEQQLFAFACGEPMRIFLGGLDCKTSCCEGAFPGILEYPVPKSLNLIKGIDPVQLAVRFAAFVCFQ